MKQKIVSADEAISLIRTGDTVAFSGFVGIGTPEALIEALQCRHAAHAAPRDLTLVFAAAPGDGAERGLNRLDAPGLVRRVIGGHWGLVPKLAKLAIEDRIEAYNLPLGTLSQLFRDIAGRRAGTVTRTGLHTFIDPRQSGGKLNARTTGDLVTLLSIGGEDWLLYRAFPIHVALLRGTTADGDGNVTMECEALVLDNLALAIGMPEAVAAVANEERVLEHVTLTAEPGVIGGYPQGGLDFGAAINTDALLQQSQQFDFYDGGGLDLAVLGLAQADADGHVNVSRFGNRLAGAGGFINITQNARRVVFAGTFTADGLRVAITDGRLRIVQEGRQRKFVQRVEQITFNGREAARREQPVLYVTERCVFRGTPEGLELIEVASGIDIEREILAQMDFRPLVRDPRPMDARIFAPDPMSLRDEMLRIDVDKRVAYDEQRNCLFVNLENLHFRTRDDVDRLRQVIEPLCQRLGRRVTLVANYDNCRVDPDVADTYAAAISYLQQNYYSQALRYSTSAFMRRKLGEGLSRRGVAPHIVESAEDAQAFVAQLVRAQHGAPSR